MGQDYNPHIKPDPNYWASCSCGEYKVYGSSTEEVQDMINEHFVDNLKTHIKGTATGGSYILHVPQKPKWWKRSFGKHKGTDNG